MPLKTQFQIVESPTKITEPITKFGGQPVWISQPSWPLCPETSEKMLFMAQISLNPELFPNNNGTMVYIFFCDECEGLWEEAIAIVIQTSDRVYKNGASYTEFVSEATGPTIYEYEYDENGQAIYKEYKKIYKEYKAVLEPIEDEEMVPLEERHKINSWDDDDTGWQFSKPQLAGNKIGGQTLLMRSLTNMPEASNSEEWLLLLQLAPKQGYWNKSPDGVSPNFYPFHMYLRDTGILTVFISSDYKQTRCYIQEP